MDGETGEPTDTLAPVAEKMIESLGSSSSSVSAVIHGRDRAVFTAITEGLDRVNEQAPSRVHRVSNTLHIPIKDPSCALSKFAPEPPEYFGGGAAELYYR